MTHNKLKQGGLLCAVALSAAACSSANNGGTANKDEILSGPQVRYTPVGCDYQVTSPTVDTAAVDSATAGLIAATTPPDHVHVGLGGDASTSFSVNWRSEVDATQSVMLFGTNEAAVTAADAASGDVKLQYGHSMLMKSVLDEQGTRIHEAHVGGLQPATAYFYKVGNAGAWSKVFKYTTAPTKGSTTPLTIAVTGDSRNDTSIWAATQKAINAAGAQLQIFSGDAVVLGGVQMQWDNFFEAKAEGTPVSDYLAGSLFMPANGNHDSLAVNYLAQFSVPQEASAGETGDGKEWYSFDYGNVHVVSLNDTTLSSTTIANEEAAWLRKDLGAVDRAKTPWIIVMHHQPTYSCSTTHGSDTAIRSAWQPIFDQYKVDFVFNGHVHNYERSKPIRGLNGSDGIVAQSAANGVPVDGSGTVYVVAAGAGAPLYDASTSCSHTQNSESVRNYVILNVEGKTLKYKAYRLDGSTLDEFTYTKN